jgi:hypothetical protein
MSGPFEPTRLEPNIVLPSQFFAHATPTPERLLLLAVLEEAIGTYQRYVIASDRRGLALFAEVEAWLASEDTDWMFSYVAICDELGVDAIYLRLGLRRWRDGHRASLETRSPPYPLPFPRVNGRQHWTNKQAQGRLPGIRPLAIPAKPAS